MRRDYSSLRQGLVGAWCPSLGATGNTLADRSGWNNTATITTATYSTSGSGRSLLFGGSASPCYLNASPLATFSASASLSLWVKRRVATPSTDTNSGFLTCEGAFAAGQGSHYPYIDGLAYLRIFRSARVNPFTPLAAVNRTAWHNVTITTDGNRWRLWQAGLLASNVAAESTVQFSASLFSLGRSQNGSFQTSLFFDGEMDDIRLYNRALTPQEIRLLASGRGIGLTPLRQRRTSASSRRLYQNVAGTWKEAMPMVNDGGTWKEAAVWQNVGGTWRN